MKESQSSSISCTLITLKVNVASIFLSNSDIIRERSLCFTYRRHTLAGHTAPPDMIKVQNGRLFSMDSTLRDQSLRIWDLEDGKLLIFVQK